MAIVKQWNCLEHGEFERTHPICPSFGCASEHVVQEIRTAPGFKSDSTKRFDAGIQKSSDMYRINNFKSAKMGEASFAGRADPNSDAQVLWGDESKKVMGKSFAELTQTAAAQENFSLPNSRAPPIKGNNGMVDAARAAGITKRVLPPAGEVRSDNLKNKAKAQAIASP